MIYYKTQSEIELMRQSAQLVGKAIAEIAKLIKPGITTGKLDAVSDEFIRDHGAVPSFKNYKGYPYAACISVNDAVVHGFPNGKELRAGDIISVDVGVYKNGFHGDSAYTFAIGDPGPEILKLMKVTKESLY
ncbi:MAG TPA: M24 family metallopeptidase, partial [Flavitalea sp.]|nr:M24 family metallopeptidase [Flavitalea sp.]